jgi:hypothetical protein
MRLVIAATLAALVVLGGCSSVKKLTGQRDDSVLPGQREDVLPPEKQVAQDPNVTRSGQTKPAECAPDDLSCLPPADEPLEPAPQ